MLEVTVLGCGASAGVPRADGNWGACDPAEPRNRRSRCSLLVRRLSDAGPDNATTLIVDATPEFRLQANAAGVRRLDALLFTHDHADQCHGIDDIRAFAMAQRARIACWMDAATRTTLLNRFGYVFEGQGIYPAIADLHHVPGHGHAWEIAGPSGAIPVVTFDQDHGPVRSLGYRFGSIAYSSDLVDLPEASFAALEGLDIWIVDALRYTPHPTHAHLAKTLDWIERVRPKRAILTNMHIDLDYGELGRRLPAGVEPAYDGLTVALPLRPAKL
ncbi:MAG TPA: MBL fold metallo-hydrolase [Caulobacteraceae bacterium]|jgi:phosphoribosyl 1,2-cyclic phosphate phosphodiesterase|nr:MBL fold metallo-hydrolase [Caulobacteraceae bacterium]